MSHSRASERGCSSELISHSFAYAHYWIPPLLCFCLLWFDLITPPGVAIGIAYTPIVFCGLWYSRAVAVFIFAALASILAVLAFLIKSESERATWIVLLNLFLTLATLWFIAYLVYSHRKKWENFNQNEMRLSAVVDHALDGLITINARGIIEHFNPACERIFGYKAHEAVGRNIKILMPEPYNGEHDGYLMRYNRTGEAKIIGTPGREVTAMRKDGSVFPMNLSISVFLLNDGKHFSGIIRDITARKIAENDNALLAAIITSSEDAIISKTLDGIITSWNTGAEHLFGYTPQEAIGKHINLIIPPDRIEEENIIAEKISTGKPFQHFQTERLSRDGQNIPISLTVSPIRDAKGIIIGASKILRDITEQKKSEMRLHAYTIALERSNKELDDFAFIASHDLKEPLRGLFNNAKFLEEDYGSKLDYEGIGRLHRLSYLCQRMEMLVNDLLYFSRLGRQEMAIQRTNLNTIIHDIKLMMQTTLMEENAVIEIPTPLPEIICDKIRITEVFRNLITNAVKYNNQEFKHIKIGFLETLPAQGIIQKNVFYVRDNGIGIEEQFHEEIFRIFKRLNEEDDEKRGTGAGLTFVRKIVERHGGHIWLESEPGKGTCFYFTVALGNSHDAN